MPMDVFTYTLYTHIIICIQYTCTVYIVQIDQTKGCLLLSKTFLNSRASSAYRLLISFAHFTSTNDIQVRNKHICRLNQKSLRSRLILLKDRMEQVLKFIRWPELFPFMDLWFVAWFLSNGPSSKITPNQITGAYIFDSELARKCKKICRASSWSKYKRQIKAHKSHVSGLAVLDWRLDVGHWRCLSTSQGLAMLGCPHLLHGTCIGPASNDRSS